MRETFEPGDSLQFTFTCSVVPDGAPSFAMFADDLGQTLVQSQTSQTSHSLAYYAMQTMPNSDGVYVGEWKTNKTVAGTVYPFIKRLVFNVTRTRRGEV